MIITRTPFRVSFAGGGSDLPSFYLKQRGCVLSTSINKYMYLSVHPFFNKKQIHIKYSKTELVNSVEDIQHPIVREAMKLLNVPAGIEITSTADVPSGTGLGSSSSFTVGLLNLLYGLKEKFVSKEMLAKEACKIEIDILKEPIGKQDQYAAAYGGLNFIEFHTDNTVSLQPILMGNQLKKELNHNLVMFYTGDTRSASSILTNQSREMDNENKFKTMVKMTMLAEELRDSLHNSDLTSFGEILHKGWLLKQSLTDNISNEKVNQIYNTGLSNGAMGGKLLGAGGGGFILFYCEKEKQERLRNALKDLQELGFFFDNAGSKHIYIEETNIVG